MRQKLRRIHEHERTAFMCHSRNGSQIRQKARHIRSTRDRDEFDAVIAKDLLEVPQINHPVARYPRAKYLPSSAMRQVIRMMLHFRRDDFARQMCNHVTRQVDRLRRVHDETNGGVFNFCANETRQLTLRLVKPCRCTPRQQVRTAMNVRILVL